MNITMKNGRVIVDGREFIGNNVSISGNRITVDGVRQDGELVGDIDVTVLGSVKRIELASGTIKCENVGNISTQSGDVDCNHVTGSVSTMSGDVDCGDISGNVSTMSGDVTHK